MSKQQNSFASKEALSSRSSNSDCRIRIPVPGFNSVRLVLDSIRRTQSWVRIKIALVSPEPLLAEVATNNPGFHLLSWIVDRRRKFYGSSSSSTFQSGRWILLSFCTSLETHQSYIPVGTHSLSFTLKIRGKSCSFSVVIPPERPSFQPIHPESVSLFSVSPIKVQTTEKRVSENTQRNSAKKQRTSHFSSNHLVLTDSSSDSTLDEDEEPKQNSINPKSHSGICDDRVAKLLDEQVRLEHLQKTNDNLLLSNETSFFELQQQVEKLSEERRALIQQQSEINGKLVNLAKLKQEMSENLVQIAKSLVEK